MDTFKWLLLSAVAVGIVGLLVRAAAHVTAPTQPKPVYERRPALLSKGEFAFYRVLLSAIEGSMVVMVKVGLSDLLKVPRGTAGEQALRNRVSQKHVDFVVCDEAGVRPLVVIELDDRSHRTEKARRRDAVKDAALAAAGLPLLRVPAARSYDAATLRQQIADLQ